MAKSEARRRFNLIIAQALKEGYERGWAEASKMPDAAIEKIRKEAQKEFDVWKEGELDRAMKIREVAKREAREEIKKEIEAYFKGLIAIPDPQATLKSLLSSLTKE